MNSLLVDSKNYQNGHYESARVISLLISVSFENNILKKQTKLHSLISSYQRESSFITL